MTKAQKQFNNVVGSIKNLEAEIERKKAELNAIVEEERRVKAGFEEQLLVQHVDGSLVGKAETFVEAYEMMKADAEKRCADAVRTCKAKRVKLVAAKVPTSDYVVTKCWVWSNDED